ncbi:MAG: menaquinone-dependent protoporphyrinogen IX dehydrogenase [Azoarcus sp.]|nr:menaquinone-dependent protoporphyrinogen IX dehydrogenase [Azoarcus sp.]
MPGEEIADHKSVLLLYSSRFGHSRKIADAVAVELMRAGLTVEVAGLTQTTRIDPGRHIGLGLVISVRYGHFARAAYKLVKAHKAWIESVPTLLMTISLTARKPEKRDPTNHVYTRKFLKKTAWCPSQTEVVAGSLQYPLYNVFDRACIRLIMLMMGGEADGRSEIDYTDWDRVRAAAREYGERCLRNKRAKKTIEAAAYQRQPR